MLTAAEKVRRGTKRVCPQCETRFYDLLRASIPCPTCGTEYIVATPAAQALASKPHKPYEFATGRRAKLYRRPEPVRQAELATAPNIPIYNVPEESVTPERDNDVLLTEHEPGDENDLSSFVDDDGNKEKEH